MQMREVDAELQAQQARAAALQQALQAAQAQHAQVHLNSNYRNNLIINNNKYHSCCGQCRNHPSRSFVGTLIAPVSTNEQYKARLLNKNVLSCLACREHILAPSVRVFWYGVQEKAGMQMEVQQEHNRAEEAEGFLGDAHAQVDNLEAQLNKMASKMRKVAIKLHFAINPTHKVSQNLNAVSLTLTAPSPLSFALCRAEGIVTPVE